jgi:hypothetical protein
MKETANARANLAGNRRCVMFEEGQQRCAGLMAVQVFAVTGAILCTAASGVCALIAAGAVGAHALGAADPGVADAARVAREAVVAFPLGALVLWRVVALRQWACAVAVVAACMAAIKTVIATLPLSSGPGWLVFPADVCIVAVALAFAVGVVHGWRKLGRGF